MFTDLAGARRAGEYLGRCGQFPAIYQNESDEYYLVVKGEWPPERSSPILKWDGEDWVPVLARLESLEDAVEATSLFVMLGHRPIVVEFPGITFDIFIKMSHIPGGAWVFSESDSDYSVKYLNPPEGLDDEDEVILTQEVSLS